MTEKQLIDLPLTTTIDKNDELFVRKASDNSDYRVPRETLRSDLASLYASIAGDAKQAFDVADATSSTQALAYGQLIVNNTRATSFNLNTAVDSGFYRLPGIANMTNAPSYTEYGQLLVMHGGGDTITQFISDFNGQYLYVRSGNPPSVGGIGNWSSWHDLLNGDSSISYKVGAATQNSEAVNLGQLKGLFSNTVNQTANRASGTTYTNSTGKPMMVIVSGAHNTTSQNYNFYINGALMAQGVDSSNNNAFPITAIVPVGATYHFTGPFSYWTEIS